MCVHFKSYIYENRIFFTIKLSIIYKLLLLITVLITVFKYEKNECKN